MFGFVSLPTAHLINAVFFVLPTTHDQLLSLSTTPPDQRLSLPTARLANLDVHLPIKDERHEQTFYILRINLAVCTDRTLKPMAASTDRTPDQLFLLYYRPHT